MRCRRRNRAGVDRALWLLVAVLVLPMPGADALRSRSRDFGFQLRRRKLLDARRPVRVERRREDVAARRAILTCPPETGPSGMRVFRPLAGHPEALDGEEATQC